MDNDKKIELLNRNKKIIQIVLGEMEKKCPDSIDLIGIGGSFCHGDYHEKSDLDLLIIRNNDSAKSLDKCFIFDGIGFDIYTQSWSDIEALQKYETPYVTKILEMGIVYFKNQAVLQRIKEIQSNLINNMNDNRLIEKRVGEHFRNALEAFDYLEGSTNKEDAYLYYARIIREVENVLYFLNKKYVKQGTKNIPEEIKYMKLLPPDFIELYDDITNFNDIEEAIHKASNFIGKIQLYLDTLGIEKVYNYEEPQYKAKKSITKEVLIGTYEELFSNYRNKLYHAVDLNNRYLSFMTISAAQEFYNEFSDKYDIPKIELIGSYDPNDLEKNTKAFEESLDKWKTLYDKFGIKVEEYNGLMEVEYLYKDEKPVIKISKNNS